MPYQVEQKGKQFILSNQNTGKVIAAHKTKEKAIAQMKAISIREKELRNEYGQ